MKKHNRVFRWMLVALAALGICVAGHSAVQAAVTYDILSESHEFELKKDVSMTYTLEIPVKSNVYLHFTGYDTEQNLKTYMKHVDIIFTKEDGTEAAREDDVTIQFDDADYTFILRAGTYNMTIDALGKTADGENDKYCSKFAFTLTGSPRGKVPATGITLNKKKINMTMNSNLKAPAVRTLTATVDPFYSTSRVRWGSGRKGIATVDQSGNITAKAFGTVTIAARAGDQRAACQVNVRSGWIELNTGTVKKLSAYVRYIEGYKEGTWKSSRPAVVSLSKTSLTAKKNGKSVLTFTCGEKSYPLTVYSYNIKKLYKQMETSLAEYLGEGNTPVIKEMGYYTKKPGSVYLRYTTESDPDNVKDFYACMYKGKYYSGEEAEHFIKDVK